MESFPLPIHEKLLTHHKHPYQAPSSVSYDSISNETRYSLVKLVMENKFSVRKASKILQIKYTTAKALIQKYKQKGSINRIRSRRMTCQDNSKEQYRKELIKQINSSSHHVPSMEIDCPKTFQSNSISHTRKESRGNSSVGGQIMD